MWKPISAPTAVMITDLPGLGSLTGARVLAEIGRRPIRFRRGPIAQVKAYAGARR